ncbi:PepSY domain-containing protein [Thermus thalpophilus]|uniref:PepSY domain-containing protein n=1 Tax=Thermus thalpophilus TaxID=2908147 RepID=UPI001FAAE136|nr:PepSY domain-containing protein [Thermus thalpophilus]
MRKMLAAGVGVLALSVLAVAQMGPKGQGGAQAPAYQGSIPVTQEYGNEDQESAAYQALAKVTAEEAVKAAQQALGTTAAPTQVSLGNENGYLVWEVVLAGQEVKVDAGTGKVLHREAVGSEGKGSKENHEEEGGQGEGVEEGE